MDARWGKESLHANFDMINQPDVPIKASCCEDGGTVDFWDGLQCLGVHQLEIIDGKILWGVGEEVLSGSLKINFGFLFPISIEITGRFEGPPNSGGVLALLRAKTGISGRECETVVLPHRGVASDFHRDIEVPDHAPDNRELLEVLVSEDRNLRLEDVEEF